MTLFALIPRAYAGFHYRVDILGGAVIGTAVMWLAHAMPSPHPALVAVRWAVSWERRRPKVFYCIAVFVTFELMTTGNDVRLVARTIPQLL